VDLNSFDAAYLEGLSAGDPAVEQHFAQYFGELLLIVLRARQFRRDTINDIRQETLLRVLKAARAKEIRDPRCLRGYVHSVCKNVIREFGRADWRTNARTEDLAEPVDERADSERELVTREKQTLVRTVIAGMSAQDRKLLSAVLEEKSSAEICREFGVDANYLRVKMFRAREKFRQAVERRMGAGASGA
jgi:RNA polymerase sigma factor (sigma-70 family)